MIKMFYLSIILGIFTMDWLVYIINKLQIVI